VLRRLAHVGTGVQKAMKHAGAAATVTIGLEHKQEGIRFQIAVDGVEMRKSAARKGDSLVGIRDRIGVVGGDLMEAG
jgi:glucose-6-phosphate-specific signal transduction histidine kinase